MVKREAVDVRGRQEDKTDEKQKRKRRKSGGTRNGGKMRAMEK